MKALITGIGGFVGSHLAQFLLGKRNCEIAGLEITAFTPDSPKKLKTKIKIYRCDICNFALVLKAIKDFKPDLIFHLAAQSNVFDSWSHPRESLNTNIIGTLNIFEALRSLKLNSRIQIACSAEEYGKVDKKDLPVKEDTVFRPLNPYAVGKIGQDMLGYQYSRNYNMFIVRTRAFNHIGSWMSPKFVASAFARQIALIEKGKQTPAIRVGNLDAVRDFTDVRDVVRGYYLSLQKGKAGEAYNICSGKGYSIKQILNLLLSFSNCRILIRKDKSRFRPSDASVLIGDHSKFFRHTGWRPIIPLEKSLRDLLEYWRQRL